MLGWDHGRTHRPPTPADIAAVLEGVVLKDKEDKSEYVARAEAICVVGTRVKTQRVFPRKRAPDKRWPAKRFREHAEHAAKQQQHQQQQPHTEEAGEGGGRAGPGGGGGGAGGVGGGVCVGGSVGGSQVPPAPPLPELEVGADGMVTVSHSYTDLRLVMSCGRFRIVRKLLAAVGLGVVHLHRSAIGCVRLVDEAEWKHKSSAFAETTTPAHDDDEDNSGGGGRSNGGGGDDGGGAPTAAAATTLLEDAALLPTQTALRVPHEGHAELSARQRGVLWAHVSAGLLRLAKKNNKHDDDHNNNNNNNNNKSAAAPHDDPATAATAAVFATTAFAPPTTTAAATTTVRTTVFAPIVPEWTARVLGLQEHARRRTVEEGEEACATSVGAGSDADGVDNKTGEARRLSEQDRARIRAWLAKHGWLPE